MPQFKSLKEIENHLKNSAINSITNFSPVKDTIANTMSQAVHETVYQAYTPEAYVRRANEGGLSDTDNIVLDETSSIGSKVIFKFVNKTPGADSLADQPDGTLGETIEDGIVNNWTYPGPWVRARKFNEATASKLNSNPLELINSLKTTLISSGIKIR